ncbi:protein of unknown function [Kyrpidia spormannii]|uniref:Uncharacterized protein n=1 Tax=Kyrpidia spormannii TaxID=2055160 RepID=A0A6F9E1M6_9BACL|nr:protein of unknown function [Kyrpidia spormannii]
MQAANNPHDSKVLSVSLERPAFSGRNNPVPLYGSFYVLGIHGRTSAVTESLFNRGIPTD